MTQNETKKYKILCQDNLSDGIGAKKLRAFFNEVITNFAEESLSFHKIWGDFPFIYGEKQIHSVLLPAIHKYTNNVWLEQPFKNYKKTQRFLDMATTHKDVIYLFELKHDFKSYQESFRTSTISSWQKAIDQINDINTKTIYKHFNKDFKIFKIALIILPTFLWSKTKDDSLLNRVENLAQDINEYSDILFDTFNASFKKANEKANFIGLIEFKKNSKYVREYSNGCEIFPYVSFIARVEEVN